MEPCTGVYGYARPCPLFLARGMCGHVRGMYGDARSPPHGGARRGVRGRLRGLEGGKGEVYGNTLGASGCVPVHVWACTGVYALVRGCTLLPGQAGLSYKLFPRKGLCS